AHLPVVLEIRSIDVLHVAAGGTAPGSQTAKRTQPVVGEEIRETVPSIAAVESRSGNVDVRSRMIILKTELHGVPAADILHRLLKRVNVLDAVLHVLRSRAESCN